MNDFYNEDWRQEILGVFAPNERERFLFELAEEYHYETERFDRMICQHSKDGIAMPITSVEFKLCSDRAYEIKKNLLEKGKFSKHQITPKEFMRAINEPCWCRGGIQKLMDRKDNDETI